MKAAVYDRYGPPEVVRIESVDRPTPKSGEVLVRVVATTVSSADWRARSMIVPRGYALPARLSFGLRAPRQRILGTELSGEIVEVGASVQGLAVGDAVIGFPGLTGGAHAEFCVLDATSRVTPKPEGLGFDEAAAFSFGGGTALHFLDKGKVAPGDRVLIIGASGCLGTAAVQIARYMGAEVTAVCGASNQELVQSIGAHHVIDYTTEDFTRASARYEVIFDTVGASTVADARRALCRDGRLLLAAGTLADELIRAPLSRVIGDGRVIAGTAPEDITLLQRLARMTEAGAYTPVIDRRYPFDRIVEAHAYVANGHKRGNVVIFVGDETDDGLRA